MIDFLKTTAIFEGFKVSELRAINKAVKPVDYSNGQIIFRYGEPAYYFYIISAGKVELKLGISIYNSTELLTIDSLEAKEVFGWSAFTRSQRYTLTAYSVGDVKLLEIDAEEIKKCCETHASLGYKLMKNLASTISLRFSKLEQSLYNYIVNTLADKY